MYYEPNSLSLRDKTVTINRLTIAVREKLYQEYTLCRSEQSVGTPFVESGGPVDK